MKAALAQAILNKNKSVDAIDSDLNLPAQVYGQNVTWSVSENDAISADGKYTMPLADTKAKHHRSLHRHRYILCSGSERARAKIPTKLFRMPKPNCPFRTPTTSRETSGCPIIWAKRRLPGRCPNRETAFSI